jgi:hypothetical protein
LLLFLHFLLRLAKKTEYVPVQPIKTAMGLLQHLLTLQLTMIQDRVMQESFARDKPLQQQMGMAVLLQQLVN